MALSNAERQKRYRARRGEQARNSELSYVGMDRDPTEYARTIMATLVAVIRAGEAKAEISLNSDDMLLIEVESNPRTVPDEVRDLLSGWMTEPWLSRAAVRLWDDGEPMRFAIRVEALSDKRKLKAAERKLEREEQEEQEDVT